MPSCHTHTSLLGSSYLLLPERTPVVGDRHFYSGNEALSFLVADLRGSQVGLLDHSQKGVPFTYRFRGRKLSVQAFKAEVVSQILSVRSDHHPALEGHQPSREFPVLFQVHWEAVPYRSLKSAPPMSGTFLSQGEGVHVFR